MANTVNESAIKKLKVLFTVVDRNKAEFYMDVISQFEVNCQMQLQGLGTATSEIVDLLGLNIHKAVILSVVRETWSSPSCTPWRTNSPPSKTARVSPSPCRCRASSVSISISL